MTQYSGMLAILKIEGFALAESQNYTPTINNAIIDVTNRDSNYWRELLSSTRSWAIAFEGHYHSAAAKQELITHYEANPPTTVTVIFTCADGAKTLSGEAYLTTLSFPSPYEGAAMLTGTLEGTGKLTFSAS
jgi:predicted secreted protein